MPDATGTGFTIAPEGAFSLAAAESFGFGPNMGRPKPDTSGMSLAFVADDLVHHAAAVITQDPDETLHLRVYGDADPDLVAAQVRRILSLDQSGELWSAVGERDPVIGELQAAHRGLRPVLFHSPYEAAAWSILSQRRHRVQAATLRKKLSATHGRVFELPSGNFEAFPTPEALLRLESFPGLEPARIDRLHGVARAAMAGELDPARLLAASQEDALAGLLRLPGIGPTYGTLILLRSTGATDILTLAEPRIPAYAGHFYGLGGPASTADLARLSEKWRPFRTWTCVLLRVAGDSANLPWER